MTVTRRSLAWLVALPLAVAGTQVAHALAYRLVAHDPSARAHELASSGHSYLDYLPLALAVGAVVVLLALAAELRDARTGAQHRLEAARLWRFAVLAPAIFVCQEHFERLAHGGSLALATATEPTFAIGLLLQAPFALAAYLLARLLLGAVRTLARLLSGSRPKARIGSSPQRDPAASCLPRVPALALGYGSRGPPAILEA